MSQWLAGFLQQFAAVCRPGPADTNIAAVLKELSGGRAPNRVICCGHSLGGALATLGMALATLGMALATLGMALATLGMALATLGMALATLGMALAALGMALATLGMARLE